ncbi:MAG: hypothetical protein IKT62_03790 [Firmicutes bacterium]|nr:hypothetical protein [Bacillota bacterium]
MMKNNYGYFPFNNGMNHMPQRKIGFWDVCLAGVAGAAAVKIVRTLANRKEVNDNYDDKEDYEGEYDPNAPIDYVLYESDKLTNVIKCRRKIAELNDLYGCFTEKEIRELMGEKATDDLEYQVFDERTKFNIRFKGGKYRLLSQKPYTAFDDELENDIQDKEEEDNADEA